MAHLHEAEKKQNRIQTGPCLVAHSTQELGTSEIAAGSRKSRAKASSGQSVTPYFTPWKKIRAKKRQDFSSPDFFSRPL